jgi:hypothetical protein
MGDDDLNMRLSLLRADSVTRQPDYVNGSRAKLSWHSIFKALDKDITQVDWQRMDFCHYLRC